MLLKPNLGVEVLETDLAIGAKLNSIVEEAHAEEKIGSIGFQISKKIGHSKK